MEFDMKLINLEDFPIICRVCLNKEGSKPVTETYFINLFENILYFDFEDELKLPKNVCEKCYLKLEEFDNFVKLAQESHMLLKKSLERMKIDVPEDFKLEINEINNQDESQTGSNDSHQMVLKNSLEGIKIEVPYDFEPEIKEIKNQDESQIGFNDSHQDIDYQSVINTLNDNYDLLEVNEIKKEESTCSSPTGSHGDEIILSEDIPNKKNKMKGDANFQCKICSKKFNYKANLIRHKEIVHQGIKPFKCETCGKDFATKHRMKEHLNIHTGERPYGCELCGATFKKLSTRRAHLLRHKKKEKQQNKALKPRKYVRKAPTIVKMECKLCKETFSSIEMLSDHIMSIHRYQRLFLCPICGKNFVRKVNLELHQRIHTGEKPFKCDICEDRAFSHPSTYRNHMLIHEAIKPYVCTICLKSFTQSGHLKSHLTIHSGLKPHECTVCGKCFRDKGNLATHMKRHANDKNDPINVS